MGFLSFLKKSKGNEKTKERLQLLLVQDRISLSPELVDNMRRDLIDVITRYVDVEKKDIVIDLKRKEEKTMLLANIPVKNVRR